MRRASGTWSRRTEALCNGALLLSLACAAVSPLSATAAVVKNDRDDAPARPASRKMLRSDGDAGSTVIGPLPPEGSLRPLAAMETPEQAYDAGLQHFRARTAAGTPQYTRAVDAWRRAAARDEPRALAALAYLYLNGFGVSRDLREARVLASRSADLGNPRAYFLLAQIRAEEGDDAAAIELLEQGSGLDDALAMNELGVRSELGEAIPIDLSRARDYYRRSAGKGSVAAQRNLLRLAGTQKDQDGVVDRLQAAKALAESGDRAAMYNLGVMNHRGEGTGMNYQEALRWYQKSAAKQYAKARNMLALIFSRTTPAGDVDTQWMRQIALMIATSRPDLGLTIDVKPERPGLFD